MKNLLIATIILGLFSSCKKDKDNNDTITLEGTWNLTEVLMDPGDGSGTFQKVTSDKSLNFNGDSSVISNGDLCSANPMTGGRSVGNYSSIDKTITVNGCGKITYEQTGNTLIVTYPCIEPCKAKFVK